ncbi:MAG: hypothetical protein ABJV04_01395 [Aliiglaciecola sp.]|uniref:hypothetical protein n=1 Tax=Aliiglaciecola sp. TaxID=1872441 RepID=UPI0032997030
MKFLNNFIEQLCEAENLIDISSKCSAQQSSTSKWSKEDDARQVLIDNKGDFANHTAPELNPWLIIDLEKLCYPAYIIIQNRSKKPFDEIASRLSVECSSDSIEYKPLHKGELHFGHLPDSMPLILPLKGKIASRFIKLSLVSSIKMPLHLKRVNILIGKKPDLTQNQNNVVFYSSRNDGLGERLKSLLNAIVLSDLYNTEFKFTWSNPPNLGESHAVTEADSTFSPAFYEKHVVETLPNNIHELDKRINFFNRSLEKKPAIRVSQRSIYNQIPELKNYISSSAYAKAFSKIEFSANINEAINLAKSLELPANVVSIHLRGGDIVYGRYRHGDRYTSKVISHAQADYIISSLKNTNINVLIFGQNKQVCRYFADKFNAFYFGDRADVCEFSSMQLAIFDMVLMSRSNKIFSGSSGFSQLSALIGSGDINSPEDYFNATAMANHILKFLNSDELRHFDDFQNAFACWHLVFSYRNIVGLDKSIRLLEKACSFDVNNLFYLLVLSTLYFEKGDYKSSERAIDSILKRTDDTFEKEGTYKFLKAHKHPDGTGPLQNYKQKFLNMKSSNLVGAAELAKDFS